MSAETTLLQRSASAAFGLALLAVATALFAWVKDWPAFALRRIEVTTAPVELEPGLLEAVLRNDVRGTFFSVSLEAVRAALLKLPWVREARVSRHWPGTLRIALVEYRAVAQWSDQELLAEDGTVFRATTRRPLPRFEASSANPLEALNRFRDVRRVFSRLGLKVKRFGMTDRGAVWAEAEGGLRVEFGREQFAERLERFAQAWAQWSEAERAQIARVDLRYRAAVAVEARQGVTRGGGA
ncbi:MAG: cell division protein FtsQ/DivIB [Casimicrobiaceae bacterium]|nr:cell division protein FtsQ/DivIB [Casimicrobiaceae bacterium]MDW8311532.1 cell division protein FtsQ/DivIB [Burkholderiales bacterium]